MWGPTQGTRRTPEPKSERIADLFPPAPYAPKPAYHPEPYHEEKPKDYQFGYDVHGYDEYGNANVHSRTEQRDGYNVKGNNISENLETQSQTEYQQLDMMRTDE